MTHQNLSTPAIENTTAMQDDPLAAEFGKRIAAPADCAQGGLEGLEWRTRPYSPSRRDSEDQFLVMASPEHFAATGQRVLGSGFSHLAAAWSARRSLAYHQQEPAHFYPELAGCRFGTLVASKSAVLIHTCLDVNGAEIGRGDGKSTASLAALRFRLAHVPAAELSQDQFASICATAPVRSGVGRRSLPTVYDGHSEQGDQVRALLRRIYDVAPTLRLRADEGQPEESRIDFVARMQTMLLSGRFSGGVRHLELTASDEPTPLCFHFVFHTITTSRETAIRIAHGQAITAWQEENPPVEAGRQEEWAERQLAAA